MILSAALLYLRFLTLCCQNLMDAKVMTLMPKCITTQILNNYG